VEITVSSRHAEVSDALRNTTFEKIGRLGRFLDGMERAEVHFSEERNPRISASQVCEVTMAGHGQHVRAKVAAADQFAAVDLAIEKLENQLTKLKTKLVRRNHSREEGAGAKKVLATTAVEEAEDDDHVPRIVKTKRFSMKPMVPDEAISQMDLLGHEFFFFTNAESGQAAVVYRRDDGDVGLIEGN